jgi:hypothetical protein
VSINYNYLTKEYGMAHNLSNKNLTMLGDAVRRERNNQLDSLELGKLIMSYVLLLEQEEQRDARDTHNGKGE